MIERLTGQIIKYKNKKPDRYKVYMARFFDRVDVGGKDVLDVGGGTGSFRFTRLLSAQIGSFVLNRFQTEGQKVM